MKGGTLSDATSLSEAVLQLPCENIQLCNIYKGKADFKYIEMFTRFDGINIFNLSLSLIKRKKTRGGTFSDATYIFICTVKIKQLLRILGLLLNDGLRVKAICGDCTSAYFNLQRPLPMENCAFLPLKMYLECLDADKVRR